MHIWTQIARLATALALVAALAAVTTPDARSGHQDLGYRGESQQSDRTGAPDALDRYIRNNAPSVVRPDDRAGVRGVGALASEDASDALDRYLANHRAHEQQVAADPTVREQPDGFQPQLRGVDSAPVASPGFDWETTGLVTGVILAAMLLAFMSTIALRHRRGLRNA